MTDKDLPERSVLREVFPESNLYLCKFHVMQIFEKIITKSKMNIDEKTRIWLLNLSSKMANSASLNEYNIYYTEFFKKASPEARDYFKKNWNPIKQELVKAFSSECSFCNFTNN